MAQIFSLLLTYRNLLLKMCHVDSEMVDPIAIVPVQENHFDCVSKSASFSFDTNCFASLDS